MCLEVVKGFMGYFSEFKEVFFVVLLGIFSTRPKLDVRSMIAGFPGVQRSCDSGSFLVGDKGGL